MGRRRAAAPANRRSQSRYGLIDPTRMATARLTTIHASEVPPDWASRSYRNSTGISVADALRDGLTIHGSTADPATRIVAATRLPETTRRIRRRRVVCCCCGVGSAAGGGSGDDAGGDTSGWDEAEDESVSGCVCPRDASATIDAVSPAVEESPTVAGSPAADAGSVPALVMLPDSSV